MEVIRIRKHKIPEQNININSLLECPIKSNIEFEPIFPQIKRIVNSISKKKKLTKQPEENEISLLKQISKKLDIIIKLLGGD